MVEELIDDFIEFIRQAAMPILFLVLVFVGTAVYRLGKKEWKDKYIDGAVFVRNIVIAHGMACGFAFIYSIVQYFVQKKESDFLAILMLFLFYFFALKIVRLQNSENGGYIENFEGASGAIMYVTSALSPKVFVFIHAVLACICFALYKRNDNDEVWKKRIYRRAIDCVEALFVSIIVKIFMPHTFIGCLWINSIIIAVFTVLMPEINKWIYERFSLD